jgi:plastocyanin
MEIGRSAKRVLLAAVLMSGGLAVAFAPSSIGVTAWPTAGSAIYPGEGSVGKDAPLHIDALDFFFEGVPPSNHPGVKPVTFHNRSDHEEHEIVIFKLANKDATIAEAVAAANEFGEHGLVQGGFATAELGELKTAPNTSLDGSFDFAEPGGYVYYCFIDTHGGHWNYGMVGKILISEPAPPAPA